MLAQTVSESGLLSTGLFESPGYVMAFLALCFAVTRVLGRRLGHARLMHLSWVSFGLIVALFATSYFVTTPREQLKAAVKDLLLAVEDGRLDDVRGMIDAQAMTQFLNQELTREQVIGRIEAVDFDDILLMSFSSALGPEQGYGITGLRVNARGTVADFPGTQVSEWAIRWRWVDGRWVAVRLECLELGFGPLGGAASP